jgi:hypothetical protein
MYGALRWHLIVRIFYEKSYIKKGNPKKLPFFN